MNFRINNVNQAEILEIANKLSLQPETVAILFSRGITTEEEIRYFLNPGRHHFKDPFLLGGVKETVERLEIAKEMEETVVIYGDYDADGICATAIMYLALTEYGINAVPFVPERATGYGLSTENIEILSEDIGGSVCKYSFYNDFMAIQELLNYGLSCEVLEPEYLRDEIKEKIFKIGELYG